MQIVKLETFFTQMAAILYYLGKAVCLCAEFMLCAVVNLSYQLLKRVTVDQMFLPSCLIRSLGLIIRDKEIENFTAVEC